MNVIFMELFIITPEFIPIWGGVESYIIARVYHSCFLAGDN